MYAAQILCISVRYMPDLLQNVRDNYSEWLKMAIEDLLNCESTEI